MIQFTPILFLLTIDSSILTWRPPPKPFQRGFESFCGIEAQKYTIPVNELKQKVASSLYGSTWVLNGAGRNSVYGETYGHWFDGDGLLSKIKFVDGAIELRSRFVQTSRKIAQDHSESPFPKSGVWTPKGGRKGSFIDRLLNPVPTNPSNTNVMWLGGKLLALCEGGPPMRMDPDSLATLGEERFEGALDMWTAFSAHPKTDPITGEVVNIGLILGVDMKLSIMKMDSCGAMRQRTSLSLSEITPIHDFAITAKYIVIPLQPFELRRPDLIASMFGVRPVGQGFRWYPNEPHSSFLILSRSDLSLISTIQVPTFSSYHVCNAFDRPDGTISVCIAKHRGSRERLESVFKDILHAEFDADLECDLVQYDLDPVSSLCTNSRAVSPSAMPMEFPSVNPSFLSRPFRFAYSPYLSKTGFLDGFQKIDVRDGTVTFHQLPDGYYATEAVFVPNTLDPTVASLEENEDDGSLLAMVYNSKKHVSEVLLLDAKTMEQRIRIPLPHHIPYHFHSAIIYEAI